MGSLKRSYGAVTKSRRRNPNTSHIAPPLHLNQMIEGINKMFPDMKLSINRPGGTKLNAIVEVHLDRILKAVLIFKGMMIEWVVVKGLGGRTGQARHWPAGYMGGEQIPCV